MFGNWSGKWEVCLMKTYKSQLSVIIPLFNCEKYISRCLDSLIDSRPHEIIIVDDCSTDESRSICEKYEKIYEHIHLFCNKKNSGVTYSRYFGLKHAKGKYVTFVDADDWVNDSFLEMAECEMERSDKIDVVIGKMINIDANGTQRYIIDFSMERLLDKKEALEELFLWNIYRWEMWGKVYKKSLFSTWKPDYSIKVCEDLDCVWQIFQNANYVLALPEDFYYYYFNENSTTNTINYSNNGNYKVFERILNDRDCCKLNSYEIIKVHYLNSLRNIIREAIVRGCDGIYIANMADKYNAVNKNPVDKIEIDEFRKKIEMFKRGLNCLLGNLEEHRNVYFYGTGKVAAFALKVCKTEYSEKIEYIVSDNQMKRDFFAGKPVHYISDINKCCPIVLTVNCNTQKNLLSELRSRGFENVFLFNTYGVV